MNVIGLSDYHEKNLRTLARYLLKYVPRSGVRFHMMDYAEEGHAYSTDCGSVGCAVGHGPFAGIEKFKTEGWYDYSSRVFGLITLGGDTMHNWCFGGGWHLFDNAPRGAALRILWLLDKGLPESCTDRCYLNYKPRVVFVPEVEWSKPNEQKLQPTG